MRPDEARDWLTVDEVKSKIVEIEALVLLADYEAAHAAEDKFYVRLLRQIARPATRCGAPSAQVLAKLALEVADRKYPRW